MSVRANKCVFYHNVQTVKEACHYRGFPTPCIMALGQNCKNYYLKSQIEKQKKENKNV